MAHRRGRELEGEAMEFHLGRLIDHVHIRVSDLERSKRFYRAVLRSLGRDIVAENAHHFSSDELFVSADGEPSSQLHLSFQTPDRDAVRQFHAAGLAAGGRDNGAPGERSYHPGYYAAYVLDPDGHNIEAVHHGPTRRTASSVIVTPG